ncbi:MAG: hypothetical protein AAGD04_14840 [Pseudomonadota bacterium]
MRAWVLFSPLIGLVAVAGYLGFKAGQPVSETLIINAYADRYVAEFAGARTDCLARPGEGAVRMTVECQTSGGDLVIYTVGPRGGLLEKIVQTAPEA